MSKHEKEIIEDFRHSIEWLKNQAPPAVYCTLIKVIETGLLFVHKQELKNIKIPTKNSADNIITFNRRII